MTFRLSVTANFARLSLQPAVSDCIAYRSAGYRFFWVPQIAAAKVFRSLLFALRPLIPITLVFSILLPTSLIVLPNILFRAFFALVQVTVAHHGMPVEQVHRLLHAALKAAFHG
jgi:hypothetical protein